MVTTKHCCYGDCKSDSRTLEKNSDIYFIGFGNGFPKPDKEPEKCKRWVQNCGRKYFTIDNVKKDTYICSLHFVGGKGPTDENPDPIKCGNQIVRTRKRPCERPPYKSPKQQRLERGEAAEALLLMNKSEDRCTSATEEPVRFTSDTPSATVKTVISTGVTCKPSTQDQDTQTEKTPSSVIVKLKIQNRILENNLKVSPVPTFNLLKRPTKQSVAGNFAVSSKAHFNIESVKNDDKILKFYTGLTYMQLMCLWNFLGNCTRKMNFWNSSVNNLDKTPSKRPGPRRAIAPLDQLFMTLIRLRLGLLHQDLAYRFGTNTRQVSTIVMTWIQLLFKQFSALRKTMFASRRKVRKHLPKSFKKYKNIRCIIDCTEVHVQSPTNFEAQGNQYSSYKGYTSYKFLVAVAPNGAVVYVSDAFEGSITDKEIVRQSGFLDFLEPGDVIMADRGFLD